MAWLDRFLGRRIAAVMLALLLAVAGGLSALFYFEVRRVTDRAAADRLVGLARQLAPMIATAPSDASERLRRLAALAPITAALAPNASPADRAAATGLLQDAIPPDRRSVIALLDRNGNPIAGAGPAGQETWFGSAPSQAADPVPVGPYQRLNDSVLYYDVRVLVERGGTAVGSLEQRTRSTLSSQAPRTLTGLLGASTNYVVGSPASGVWTDLGRLVPAPPPAAMRPDTVSRYDWDGVEYLGLATRVARTPFVFIVRTPVAAVMAPTRTYLRGALLLTGLALLTGGLGAVAIGRWLSRPIEEIAHTAERIAAGDSTLRADDTSPAEVGRLARAFNAMIERVGASTRSLRESEERYRLLGENASDVVTLRDANDTLLYMSPSGEALLGHPIDTLMKHSALDLVHPDDLEPLRRAREEVLRPDGPGTATATYRVRRGGGPWVWLETVYRRTTIRPGEPPGILAAGRDITARKRLEEQIQQSQKLEAVGRLAGGIAHDFNNLLTAILGEVDIANRALPDDHPAREALDGIGFAAERAASLTAQLLIFSRHQVTQPRLLDLNAVLSTMDRMLRRVIGEHVELVTRLAKDLPAVRADEAQIGQVVLNLAVNARDAMPTGGTLTIETRRMRLDEEYARTHAGVIPGEYALISVADTGAGMTPDIAAHIFEPFFTSKGLGKGTGLGLATCHGIVTEAGGHLWFYTEPGLGTTFKVYLPMAAGDPASAPGAGSASEARGTETILLVEDEPAVRAVTSRMLRSLGYAVQEAPHGQAALALADTFAQPPHLVITDIVMPHMGGRELVDRLRDKLPRLRALFISGYAEDAVSRNGHLEDGVAFLQKPFTRSALARAVREVLDS